MVSSRRYLEIFDPIAGEASVLPLDDAYLTREDALELKQDLEGLRRKADPKPPAGSTNQPGKIIGTVRKGIDLINTEKFVRNFLNGGIDEEDLYLAERGTSIFQGIVEYAPPFKVGGPKPIRPYSFPEMDMNNIAHNSDEMCGEEFYEVIILGGGSGMKERMLCRGAAKIWNLEVAPDFAELFARNVPNSTTLLKSFMDKSDAGILNPHQFEKEIPPTGLPRKFINLGGFFGNPPLADSRWLLGAVRKLMGPDDDFLLGFSSTDTDKMEEILSGDDRRSLLKHEYGFETSEGQWPWRQWGVNPIKLELTRRLKFREVDERQITSDVFFSKEEGHLAVQLKLDMSQHPRLEFQHSVRDGALTPLAREVRAEFPNVKPIFLNTRRTPEDVARHEFDARAYKLKDRPAGFENQPYRPPDGDPYVKAGYRNWIWDLKIK